MADVVPNCAGLGVKALAAYGSAGAGLNHMKSASERLPTGIAGLDAVLGGGVIDGGIYIIQGAPGAGKTILGNQICFAHGAHGRRALYVTLLAESHSRTGA